MTSSFSKSTLLLDPSPIASSTSSLVVLASSCPSLQTPTLFSNHVLIPPQNMLVLSNSIRLCHLNHCFLQSQHFHQVHCPLFLHPFCKTHCSHHCSLGPSQNCHFIFSQTPCLTPIIFFHNTDLIKAFQMTRNNNIIILKSILIAVQLSLKLTLWSFEDVLYERVVSVVTTNRIVLPPLCLYARPEQ